MPGTPSNHDRIVKAATTWEGVKTAPGRFGSVRLMLGRRELGHVHGDTVLDMPLPVAMKGRLIAEGRALPHRFTPERSGWVSVPLRDSDRVDDAIELLRERYEAARAKAAARS
jgi:hypothetical protein